LALEAIEGFDLEELLHDMLRTGGESQRVLMDFIIKKNFGFFISLDAIRSAEINPFKRIQLRLAN
jgi:hypothetical protein